MFFLVISVGTLLPFFHSFITFYYIKTVILKVLVRLFYFHCLLSARNNTFVQKDIRKRRSCVFTRMNSLMDPFASPGHSYFTKSQSPFNFLSLLYSLASPLPL